MYSRQASNVPTRLQNKNSYSLKDRSKKAFSMLFKRPLSLVLAIILVTLSLVSTIFAANKIDGVFEVGFEPEYQTGANTYYSDNDLFSQYDGDYSVNIVYHGNQNINVYSKSVSVEELLSKLSMTLGENDKLNCTLTDEIYDGMTIVIDRVTTETRVETSSVPYEKESVQTSSLMKGVTKITQQGVNGEKTTTIVDTYVNGELTESEITKEEITKSPVNEITSIGTKLAADTTKAVTTTTTNNQGTTSYTEYKAAGTYTAKNGTTYQYSSYIDVVATAYGYEAGSITATGKAVSKSYMAVDPKVIAYHTKCFVTGVPLGTYGDMGVLTAEDCGAFKGKRIDIFLGDETSCNNFGRRSMRVFILA